MTKHVQTLYNLPVQSRIKGKRSGVLVKDTPEFLFIVFVQFTEKARVIQKNRNDKFVIIGKIHKIKDHLEVIHNYDLWPDSKHFRGRKALPIQGDLKSGKRIRKLTFQLFIIQLTAPWPIPFTQILGAIAFGKPIFFVKAAVLQQKDIFPQDGDIQGQIQPDKPGRADRQNPETVKDPHKRRVTTYLVRVKLQSDPITDPSGGIQTDTAPEATSIQTLEIKLLAKRADFPTLPMFKLQI